MSLHSHRTILLLLNCFFLTVGVKIAIAQSEWVPLSSPTRAQLRSVSFINRDTGWIAGDSGAFYTSDGGSNWSATGPKGKYSYVKFINRQLGWLCSNTTIDLFKTTDGGINWVKLRQPEFQHGIEFMSADTGFLCSFDSVFRTFDGGITWSGARIGFSYPCKVVRLTPAHLLVFGRGVGDPGFMEQSYDGGATWDSTYNPQTRRDFFDAFATDSMTIYAVLDATDSALAKSTDGGNTWKREEPCLANTHFMQGIWFTSKDTGYAIGDRGYLGKTTDAGATWAAQELDDSTSNMFAIQFIGSETGYVAGTKGLILKLTGKTQSVQGEKFSGSMIQSTVLPVPSSGIVSIYSEALRTGIAKVSLFDFLGREVTSQIKFTKQSTGADQLTLDLSRLRCGVYCYRFGIRNQIASGKLILER